MNINEILMAAAIVGGLGAIFGIGLALASKAFAVEVDERVTRVREVVPGANCGACGFAGCDAFSDAVVSGKAKTNGCPVGGESVAAKIAEILGTNAAILERATARVMCSGKCSTSTEKYIYEGIDDCMAASQLFGGHKSCSFGCLGHGNCVKACQFDAIHVIEGVALVDENRCLACEACVAACPKNLINMVPADKKYAVLCRSKDKGSVVKSNCNTGCIGCGLCKKACTYGAINLEGPLAVIDPALCTNCGDCVSVCPTKAIKNLSC